jgi:preprotein translocase subunit SecF
MELSYDGPAKVSVDASEHKLDLVISGAGAENRTESLLYTEYPTVGKLAEKLNAVDGLTARVVTGADISSGKLFVNSAVTTVLSDKTFRMYAGKTGATVADVRAAVADFDGVAVKRLGTGDNISFQIRLADNGEEGSSMKLQQNVTNALNTTFGESNVAVIKTDFIGSQFSQSLVSQAALLVLATLLLIWLYATIRFHWDFALGSVIAVVHDALIMMTFITLSRMEFSTTTLAAILTIIGYSINATVVILDRVRSNMKILEVKKFNEVLDQSLTDTLSRSIITTVTTLFAVGSLYVFTTGSIKDFALALIVGLISGCYSSIFISSGFISVVRRHWKPENGIHHAEKSGSNVIAFDSPKV